MSGTQRFQYKLWDLVNTNNCGSVHWNKAGDGIIFNFIPFKKEFLDQSNDFCKSNKLASFVRQLNLYGFRKVSDLRKMRKRDSHEFKHFYFLRGREDLLRYVKRNSISPKSRKKVSAGRRKKGRNKKKCRKGEQESESRKKRGRPRKCDQYKNCQLKCRENDHSYEKRESYNLTKKCTKKTSVVHQKDNIEESAKQLQFDFHNQKNHQGGENMFGSDKTYLELANLKVKESSLIKNYRHDNETQLEWYSALIASKPESYNKKHTGTDKRRDMISALSDITNVAKAESMSKFETHNKVPTYMMSDISQVPLSAPRPKIHKWEMQAMVDENQHVLLQIHEPSLEDYKSEIIQFPPEKANQTNCFEWKTPYKKTVYLSEKALPEERKTEKASVKCILCNLSTQPEKSEVYKSLFSYETDCEITDEFLDLREAYFSHYRERCTRNCTCSTPFKIYQQL